MKILRVSEVVICYEFDIIIEIALKYIGTRMSRT